MPAKKSDGGAQGLATGPTWGDCSDAKQLEFRHGPLAPRFLLQRLATTRFRLCGHQLAAAVASADNLAPYVGTGSRGACEPSSSPGAEVAAMSLSRSQSALGAFYRRLCARMGKPRANTATAHKLARMPYFMLTRGEAFVDEGQQHYEEQQRQRSVAALKRRAAALGFVISPKVATA